MRVVGGSARGANLSSVPGDTTRPVLDRVKTSLFDILRPELPGMRVLDLFGGSGAVGIEALSQGAEHCTFIDITPAAVLVIRANLAHTKLQDRAEVREYDAFSYLRSTSKQFHLIYVAPPQFKSLWVQAIHDIAERPHLFLKDSERGCQVIAQVDPKEYEKLELSGLEETSARKYGNTLLVFFRVCKL